MTNHEPLIGIVEGARYLNVGEKYVRTLIKTGALPAILVAGRYRFTKENLERATQKPKS